MFHINYFRTSLYAILCACTSSSFTLTVTKYDVDTFKKYYRVLDEYYNGSQSEQEYEETNLFEYCHQLRLGSVYQVVHTPQDFWQPPVIPCFYKISKEKLEMEKRHVQMQLTRFRLINSSTVFTLYSFWCLNYEGELKWLIAPAFIPNSAFLFSIESFHSFATSKEIQKEHDIVATFTGIIDEPPSEHPFGISEFLVDQASETIDPICELHGMLKFRLCSIITQTRRFGRFHRITNDVSVSSQRYQNHGISRYHQSDPDKSCRLITFPVKNAYNEMVTVSRKMLRCYLNNEYYGPGNPFYLGLSGRELHFIEPNGTRLHGDGTSCASFNVPLIRHLDEYTYILGNNTT